MCNIFLSSCLLGEEEELYFGWGRRLEEETRWWVEEKKRYLMGMGEEMGGWGKKWWGKKINKGSEWDMCISCKEIY